MPQSPLALRGYFLITVNNNVNITNINVKNNLVCTGISNTFLKINTLLYKNI